MWLITKEGFVSVVRKGNEKGKPFCVRSRDSKSVENIIEALGIKREIYKNAATDYQYRIFLSEEELKTYTLHAVENISYDNFKSAVYKISPPHAKVYGNVWRELWQLGR